MTNTTLLNLYKKTSKSNWLITKLYILQELECLDDVETIAQNTDLDALLIYIIRDYCCFQSSDLAGYVQAIIREALDTKEPLKYLSQIVESKGELLDEIEEF